jgi:rhodanese-related sulfurtransferase
MTTIYNVNAKTLTQWLEANEAVLVDVREPGEYNSEHIEHARSLPLSQITITEAHLPGHQHKKLVIHCQSGRRSMMACEKLKNDGAPFDIWNLEGGIVAWKQHGLPTVSAGKKFLPLDRQVQLTIGLVLLVGTALGFFVSLTWFAIPAIIGLGLTNAGLTGWCGMAKLMAIMPWNRG